MAAAGGGDFSCAGEFEDGNRQISQRIVRLYNLMGLITPAGRDMFNGPAGRWVDTLATLYTGYQMNTFIYWPSGDRERQSRIFAQDVVAAAREALASATA